MTCLSLATTLYLPASSELVSKISRGRAPGTFFAIHSICWSLGFVVGPIIGGFLIEKQASGLFLWISLVIIAIINIAILKSIELDSKE